MFDLVDLLKNKQPEKSEKERISSVLFYQTDKCLSLVTEAYRFEGIADPEVVKNSDTAINEHVRQQGVEIVIIELNDSLNVSEDALRISHLLPSHASVIVIGSEDAISTIRNLKAMGFYYLFWPITKQELIDFVRSVSDNRQHNKGVGQKRRAKRISVLGSKGGVGTTLLTAELAHELVGSKGASCIVIDHQFYTGNLDIMLGLKKFERRKVQKGSFANSVDLSAAKNLLVKESDMLSVLSLTSETMSEEELHDYHSSAVELLHSECNFILQDYSASTGACNIRSPKWLDSDCIILVISATVSSLREAARMKALIDGSNASKQIRLLVVVNHLQPEKHATVTEKDIEQFLKIKPDLVMPYNGNINQNLLEGRRVSKSRSKTATSVKKLASLVVGEKIEQGNRFDLTKLFRKRVAS
ncbi:AAA family ATPase [Methylophaga thalassica]|uniref:AAA family ATPase n=1 Tax=Methylophaga aminisulfidivorans TaxID=230105 RepID=UPI003A928E02